MASNQHTLPNVAESETTLLTGVNENVYEDQSIGADLTRKDINRVAWRSMLLQASFNYERMQASGWLYGLLPALKKIHTNPRDLARAMKGHMGFFNTHPFLVTFVIGIILAMERSKQDVNSIQNTKIAVGAPLGGIGDAMFWLTLLPICGGIGAGARQALAQAGIRLFPGVQGPADEAVQALLAGTLAYDPDTVCAHHHSGHEEGHACAHGGENGCQHGSCGA